MNTIAAMMDDINATRFDALEQNIKAWLKEAWENGIKEGHAEGYKEGYAEGERDGKEGLGNE